MMIVRVGMVTFATENHGILGLGSPMLDSKLLPEASCGLGKRATLARVDVGRSSTRFRISNHLRTDARPRAGFWCRSGNVIFTKTGVAAVGAWCVYSTVTDFAKFRG